MKDVPTYLKIKQRLLEELENKPVNTPIFSERELAAQYQVSRMTARKAINELVDEGFLYRDKNKGTFIADQKLLKKNTSTEGFQYTASTEYRIIYFSVKPADKLIAPHLEISSDDMMLRIVRLNLKNALPQSIEEIYYTISLIPEEIINDLDYLLNFKRYINDGCSITQKFLPIIIPVKYVNLLELKNNIPIIMVESTIISKNGHPLVYIREYNHPTNKLIEITT